MAGKVKEGLSLQGPSSHMPTIPFLFSQLCLPYSYSSIHHLISFHIPFPNSNQPTQYEWPAVQGGAFLFISRYGPLLRGALLYQLSMAYNKLTLTCGLKKCTVWWFKYTHIILLQFWKPEGRNVLQWAQIKVSVQPSGSLQKRKQLSQFLELHSLLHSLAYSSSLQAPSQKQYYHTENGLGLRALFLSTAMLAAGHTSSLATKWD